MSRADKYSFTSKREERYSDFLNNFDMNPSTGYLARVTNEDSVKQSIKNIVLTNIGERFYDSNKGSRINHSPFELVDPITIEMIQMQLQSCISIYEPRANEYKILMNENIDGNGYEVTIVFSIINIPGQFDLTINVKRVR